MSYMVSFIASDIVLVEQRKEIEMLQEKISLLTCQLQEKEEKIKLSLKQMKGKKVILVHG